MTKIEALELELSARKMVKGTGLCWREVLRIAESKGTVTWNVNIKTWKVDEIEPALCIIEGRPVWKGDTLYDMNGTKLTAGVTIRDSSLGSITLSWNSPKPKTRMVELLVKDVVYWSGFPNNSHPQIQRFYDACHKALGSETNKNETLEVKQ